MKFTNAFTFILTALTLLAAASPIQLLQPRDVFVPPITAPQAGITLTVGQTYTVTWDTSNAPENITNKKGMIVLRKGDRMTPLVLAYDFDILLGSIDVQVPLVFQADDYSIVLFGDSGNWSGTFTITGGPTLF